MSLLPTSTTRALQAVAVDLHAFAIWLVVAAVLACLALGALTVYLVTRTYLDLAQRH